MVKKILFAIAFLFSIQVIAETIPSNIELQYSYLIERNARIGFENKTDKNPWYIILKDGSLSDLKSLLDRVESEDNHMTFKSKMLGLPDTDVVKINDYITGINAGDLLELYVAVDDANPIIVPIATTSGTNTEQELIDYYSTKLNNNTNYSEYSLTKIKDQIASRFAHSDELVKYYEELKTSKKYQILLIQSISEYKYKDNSSKTTFITKYAKNPAWEITQKDALKEEIKNDKKQYSSNKAINKLLKYSSNFYKVTYNREIDIAPPVMVEDQMIKEPFELTLCDYLPQNNEVDEYGIKEAIKKLNSAYQRRNTVADTETPRSKSDFYHLVNVSGESLSGKAEILEDKLYLLKQKTDIDFYVVFQPVATKMNLEARKEFAKKVLAGSNLKGSNAVIITVPFVELSPTASLSTLNCIQPGIALSEPSLITEQSFKEAPDLFNYVLGAFKEVEKPAYLVRYFESVTGELESKIYLSSSNIKRLPYINGIRYYRSKYAEERDELEKTLSLLMSKEDIDEKSSLIIEYQNKIKEKVQEGSEAENQVGYDFQNALWIQQDKVVSKNVGLIREPYMTNQDLVNQFIERSSGEWAYGVKFDIVFNNGALSKEHFYNIDNFSVIDPAVFGLLDVAGLIPGLDNFADPIGMLYAGYRNNSENFMAYSMASALGGAGAAYFKQGDEVFGVVAKLDDAGNLNYTVRGINEEIAENELILTNTYVRQKDIAEEALTTIKAQQQDGNIKKLILAKKSAFDQWLNILDDLDWDAATKMAFNNDFENASTEIIEAFLKKPELVDAWKILSDYPIIRKGVTNIENLSNVISKYSLSNSQVNELAEIIAKNRSKQKLLQHLGYATKYIDNSDDLFKLARVAPIKATRSLPGTNGKIAIIGRKMDLVKVYKDELVASGKTVEIFDGNVIPANARKEFQEALELGKWLDETSEMFRANEAWAEKLIEEGYEIIDIGNLLKQEESIFYNLETKIIFGN